LLAQLSGNPPRSECSRMDGAQVAEDKGDAALARKRVNLRLLTEFFLVGITPEWTTLARAHTARPRRPSRVTPARPPTSTHTQHARAHTHTRTHACMSASDGRRVYALRSRAVLKDLMTSLDNLPLLIGFLK
jgi:hypothetical protein